LIQYFVEQDRERMQEVLEGVIPLPKDVSKVVSIRASHAIFESLRTESRVNISDLLKLQCISEDQFYAVLLHLSDPQKNLITRLPGGQIMFHDPRQRRTFEVLVPDPIGLEHCIGVFFLANLPYWFFMLSTQS
jgi:hypothetical protein